MVVIDSKGVQLHNGDYVRNINKPTDIYTIEGLLVGNFISVGEGEAIHASQVEFISRMGMND